MLRISEPFYVGRFYDLPWLVKFSNLVVRQFSGDCYELITGANWGILYAIRVDLKQEIVSNLTLGGSK